MRGLLHLWGQSPLSLALFSRAAAAATSQQGRKGEECKQRCPHQQCDISLSKACSLPAPSRLGRFPFPWLSAFLCHFPAGCPHSITKLFYTAMINWQILTEGTDPTDWGRVNGAEIPRARGAKQIPGLSKSAGPLEMLQWVSWWAYSTGLCVAAELAFSWAFLTPWLLEFSAWCSFCGTWHVSASTLGFLCEEFQVVPSCL